MNRDVRGPMLNTAVAVTACAALIYSGLPWVAFGILAFEALLWCFLAADYRRMFHECLDLLKEGDQ